MKTLGLIGGTSWHATVAYYKAINEEVGKIIGRQGNPELVIYSVNIEIMRAQDKEAINQKYLTVSQKLQQAGAEAIVICANTPHMAYEFVQPKINIPILHIADTIGQAAQAKGLKKLALFGNRPTMTGDFISGRLQHNFNLEILPLKEEVISQSHYYVSKELTRGIFSNAAKNFYKTQISKLKKQGAEGIVLGCTELPILLKDEKADLPMLKTTTLHIQKAVSFILEK